jgi:hypothetical protein
MSAGAGDTDAGFVHGAALRAEAAQLACQAVRELAMMLRLPPQAVASAQALLHQFVHQVGLTQEQERSCLLGDLTAFELAASCTLLGAKCEEHPRRVLDVANCMQRYRQRHEAAGDQGAAAGEGAVAGQAAGLTAGRTAEVPHAATMEPAVRRIVAGEMLVLRSLGFRVYELVEDLPHCYAPFLVRALLGQPGEEEAQRKVVQHAWRLLNDCAQADLLVRFSGQQVASAAILLAARHERVYLPVPPHAAAGWWELFDVTWPQLVAACEAIVLALRAAPRVARRWHALADVPLAACWRT